MRKKVNIDRDDHLAILNQDCLEIKNITKSYLDKLHDTVKKKKLHREKTCVLCNKIEEKINEQIESDESIVKIADYPPQKRSVFKDIFIYSNFGHNVFLPLVVVSICGAIVYGIVVLSEVL